MLATIFTAIFLGAAIPSPAGNAGILAQNGGDPRGQSGSLKELTAALTAPDPETRARGACQLRTLGDRAADAIEPLSALLADGSPVAQKVCERWWGYRNADQETTPGQVAASALVAIGSRSYSALENALRSPSWIARRNAAWALGALDDSRAVPMLIQALRDREAPVREQGAWALGAVDSRDATAALIKTLKDDDAGVRQQAAWALGAIGDDRAVDPLLETLRDADARVREQSAWALGVLGDSAAVASLIAALKDSDARVRRQAAWAVGVIGK